MRLRRIGGMKNRLYSFSQKYTVYCVMHRYATYAMLALAVSAFGQVWGGAKYALENGSVKFELDENGRLSSLKNKASGAEYAGGGDLWRIIYSRGDSLENEWLPSDAPLKISKPSPDKILLEYGGQFPVKIECSLDGGQVLLKPAVENASKDLVLREFQFPFVKNLPDAENSRIIWSKSGGAYAVRGGQSLRKWVEDARTSYMAEDYNAVERSELYPGVLALNCFFVERPNWKGTLYMASYDDSFQKTLHLFRGRAADGKKEREIDVGFVKYPFLKSGESREYPACAMAPVNKWEDGAKFYVAQAVQARRFAFVLQRLAEAHRAPPVRKAVFQILRLPENSQRRACGRYRHPIPVRLVQGRARRGVAPLLSGIGAGRRRGPQKGDRRI